VKVGWYLWYVEACIAIFFSLTTILHYVRFWAHWREQYELGLKKHLVPWYHLFRHVEPWMVAAMIGVAWGVHALLQGPLFAGAK